MDGHRTWCNMWHNPSWGCNCVPMRPDADERVEQVVGGGEVRVGGTRDLDLEAHSHEEDAIAAMRELVAVHGMGRADLERLAARAYEAAT